MKKRSSADFVTMMAVVVVAFVCASVIAYEVATFLRDQFNALLIGLK